MELNSSQVWDQKPSFVQSWQLTQDRVFSTLITEMEVTTAVVYCDLTFVDSRKATVIAALSFEGLLGFSNAMDQRIHASKRHKGQQKVAKVIRSLIRNKHQSSQIGEHKCFDRIMDPYTLRCIPQGTSFFLYIILFFSPRNRP